MSPPDIQRKDVQKDATTDDSSNGSPSKDAVKTVGVGDLLRGVVKMAPHATGMIKHAPG